MGEFLLWAAIAAIIAYAIYALLNRDKAHHTEDEVKILPFTGSEFPSCTIPENKNLRYVFLDVETTGLNPQDDAVVQVSAIRYIGGHPVDHISTYVNPRRMIPASATKIHGITNAMVQGAPTIDRIQKSLLKLIENAIIVGYNTKFDLNFLDKAFNGALDHVPYIDVLSMARSTLYLPNYRLETVAASFGIKPDGHFHDALADCLATAAIFFEMPFRDDDDLVRTYHSRTKPKSPQREEGGSSGPYVWQEQDLKAYLCWCDGEKARVAGNIEEALTLFGSAREGGYAEPKIFTSYAMAYRKLKDYDKEIAILEEAIQKFDGEAAAKFQERKSRAEELRASHQRREEEERQRAIRREQRAERRRQEEELAKSKPKKAAGRAVIQCAEDGTEIQQFETVTAAAEAMGIHPKGIRDAAIGKQKRAAGFAWRYAETLEAEE